MEIVGIIIAAFLAAILGTLVGLLVGWALGGSSAAKALRDLLREKKWLREASLRDRIITRSAEEHSGRARVKRTPLSKSRLQ